MTVIKSLEDLAQVVAAAQERLKAEESQMKYHIRIGIASCSIAAGASDTLKTIKGLIASHKLAGIRVTQTGCIGLCALEPIVQVQAPNQSVITYGKVTSQVARRIIQEHVINGIIVHEYVVENI